MSEEGKGNENGGNGEIRGKLPCHKLMVYWAKKQELMGIAKVAQLPYPIPEAGLSKTDCQSHGEETSPAKQCLVEIFRSLQGDPAGNVVAKELLGMLRCICNEFSNNNGMLWRIIQSFTIVEPGYILSGCAEREQRRKLLEYIAGEIFIIQNCVAAFVKNVKGADNAGSANNAAEADSDETRTVARLSGEHWPAHFDQISKQFIESALCEMSNVVVPLNNMFDILKTVDASSFVVSQVRAMLIELSNVHFNGCLAKLAPIFDDSA